jgi:hypothetical protein
VRGSRDLVDELRQRRAAADRVEVALLAQLLGDGDEVDGLTGVEQREGGAEDALVRVEVEVALVQGVERLLGGFALDEHRAEDGHLGLEGLRRLGRVLGHARALFTRERRR